MSADVRVRVTNADGSGGGDLNDRERALCERADASLRGDARFQERCGGARLVLIESRRNVGDHDAGRLSLRYEVPGGAPAVFDVREATAAVDLERGTVGVELPSED